MSLHDSVFLRPERDYRIDFFRGVALVMIFINHIPVSYTHLTLPTKA